MARKAIQPMKLHVLLEMGKPHESFKRRGPHAIHIHEAHMVGDERDYLLRLFVRKSESPSNRFRHSNTNINMVIEPDAVASLRSRFEGRRFANIVQKHAP